MASGKDRQAARKRRVEFGKTLLWGHGPVIPWNLKEDCPAEHPKDSSCSKVFWNDATTVLQNSNSTWAETGGAVWEKEYWVEKGLGDEYFNPLLEGLVRPPVEQAAAQREEDLAEFEVEYINMHYPVNQSDQEKRKELSVRELVSLYRKNIIFLEIKWQGYEKLSWEPADNVEYDSKSAVDDYFAKLVRKEKDFRDNSEEFDKNRKYIEPT